MIDSDASKGLSQPRITQTLFVHFFRFSYLVGASFTIVIRAASGFAGPRLTLDKVCDEFLQLICI